MLLRCRVPLAIAGRLHILRVERCCPRARDSMQLLLGAWVSSRRRGQSVGSLRKQRPAITVAKPPLQKAMQRRQQQSPWCLARAQLPLQKALRQWQREIQQHLVAAQPLFQKAQRQQQQQPQRQQQQQQQQSQ
mmetsp:Transcript_22999/g.58073  ORF Transcript_22999/g.58073 Transcript_22999/m.58073 type:complete len:133 (-) Transcript_22999:530-928(-)